MDQKHPQTQILRALISTLKIVTDQRGKEVTIPADVDRIASAVIPAPTLIAALDGSWDRIAGINQVLMNSNKQGIMAKIFPESLETPIVSDRVSPQIWKLCWVWNRMCLSSGVTAQDDIIQPVETAGIATVGLEYGTQEDLETWVEIFGQVIGKKDRAQEFLDYMDEEKEAVTSAGWKHSAPVRFAVLMNYGSESMTVRTERTMLTMFEAVGIEIWGPKHLLLMVWSAQSNYWRGIQRSFSCRRLAKPRRMISIMIRVLPISPQ